jgi:hypothetical protein
MTLADYRKRQWNYPLSEAAAGYPIAKGYWKLFCEAEGLIPMIVLMIVTKAKEVS